MKINLSYEMTCFFFAILEGLLFGLCYDAAKAIRYVTKKKTFSDVIFWITVIFFGTKIWYTFQNGEVRFFMVVTALLSLILYFLLLEKYVFWLALFLVQKISHIFNIIFNILLTPLKFLCKIFNIYVTKARTKFSVKVKDKNYEKKACFKT